MRKKAFILLTILALTMLPGCGGEEAPRSESGQTDTFSQPQGETAQWKTEGFAAPGEVREEQMLWAGEYLAWEKVWL